VRASEWFADDARNVGDQLALPTGNDITSLVMSTSREVITARKFPGFPANNALENRRVVPPLPLFHLAHQPFHVKFHAAFKICEAELWGYRNNMELKQTILKRVTMNAAQVHNDHEIMFSSIFIA
jgi:hypothetical protein